MIVGYFIGGPLDQTKMILNDEVSIHRAYNPTHALEVTYPPNIPHMINVTTTDYRRLGPLTIRQNQMDVYVFVVVQ